LPEPATCMAVCRHVSSLTKQHLSSSRREIEDINQMSILLRNMDFFNLDGRLDPN